MSDNYGTEFGVSTTTDYSELGDIDGTRVYLRTDENRIRLMNTSGGYIKWRIIVWDLTD